MRMPFALGALALGSVLSLLLLPRRVASVRSFGRGYDARVCVSGPPMVVMEHEVSDPSRRMGVMDHFWTTGDSEEQQASAGVQLMIDAGLLWERP